MSEITPDLTPATSRRRRRLLGSLATLTVAGALAVGSGATFSASSANPDNLYAAGTLEQTNSKADEFIFNATNLKPGDTLNGSVTITNSGTLDAELTLAQTGGSNGFTDPTNLTLAIVDTTNDVPVWSGTFGELTSVDLGTWDAGESRTYVFTSQLKASAGNAEQGLQADAEFTWSSVQTDAITIDQ